MGSIIIRSSHYNLNRNAGQYSKSFIFLKYDYSRDDYCVYKGNKRLNIKDPNTFDILEYGYSKDKIEINSVYELFSKYGLYLEKKHIDKMLINI